MHLDEYHTDEDHTADVISDHTITSDKASQVYPENAGKVPRRRWLTQRAATITLAIALIFVCGYVFVTTRGWRERAADMPVLISAILVLLAVVLLVDTLRNRQDPQSTRFPFAEVNWRLWLPLVSGLLFVALVAETFGFYSTLTIYIFMATALLSRQRVSPGRVVRDSTFFTLALMACLYLVFNGLLGIPTPTGVFL
jgi:uncharacterized membrane protein SirB2